MAESLALREIPFVFAGRNRERLEQELEVVEKRLGRSADAAIAVASNTVEELLPLLEDIEVVLPALDHALEKIKGSTADCAES